MLKEAILVVEEADKQDYDRCTAAIDMPHMQRLGIRHGDIISIEGKKKCFAFAIELQRKDNGTDIIRLSKPLRMSLGVGIGENVMVKKEDMERAVLDDEE
jgi:transitional endoplasmic reticulum ATPase